MPVSIQSINYPQGVNAVADDTISQDSVPSAYDWSDIALLAPVLVNPNNVCFKVVTSLESYISEFCTQSGFPTRSFGATYKWLRDFFETYPNGRVTLIPLTLGTAALTAVNAILPETSVMVPYQCVTLPGSYTVAATQETPRIQSLTSDVLQFLGVKHPAYSGSITYANAAIWVPAVLASVTPLDRFPHVIAISINVLQAVLAVENLLNKAIIDFSKATNSIHLLALPVGYSEDTLIAFRESYSTPNDPLHYLTPSGRYLSVYNQSPPTTDTWQSSNALMPTTSTALNYVTAVKDLADYYANDPVIVIAGGNMFAGSMVTGWGSVPWLATATSQPFYYANSGKSFVSSDKTRQMVYEVAIWCAKYQEISQTYGIFVPPAGIKTELPLANTQLVPLTQSHIGQINEANAIPFRSGKQWGRQNLIWGVRTMSISALEVNTILSWKSVSMAKILMKRLLGDLIFNTYSQFVELDSAVNVILNRVFSIIQRMGGLGVSDSVSDNYFYKLDASPQSMESGYATLEVWMKPVGCVEKILIEVVRVSIGSVPTNEVTDELDI